MASSSIYALAIFVLILEVHLAPVSICVEMAK